VSILMVLEWSGMPFETYERFNALMGIRGDDDAPEGLIDHVAAQDNGNLVICDVWESEEAFGRFADTRLRPAIEQLGVTEPQSRMMPVHNRLIGKASDANVLILIDVPDFTVDVYDRMTEQMDAHRNEHPSVSHTAAVAEGGGVFVADIWDSPESFGKFAEEQIGPAAADAGLGAFEPRILPIRNRIRGRAAHAV
jgi:heme-degrading monooxygenase HmoA